MLLFHNSRTDKDFLEDFLGVLRNGTDFDEYYFECPPINRDTYNDKSYPFEFVLMKSEGMFKNSTSMLTATYIISIESFIRNFVIDGVACQLPSSLRRLQATPLLQTSLVFYQKNCR